MNQGTNAWLKWRDEGIGSSDAPVIMGVSPYKTRRQLYNEKLGISKKEGNEYIFEKGHKIEAQARALLEIQYGGIDFRPGLCQMIDWPFLRASMDGANFEYEGGTGKEFKLVSLKEFNEGKCPERYFPQIQHQYVVTGLEKIDIVLCCEVGKLRQLKIKEVEVPLDLDYIHKKLVPALFEFWWMIQNRIQPELERGDAVRITNEALIEKIKKQKTINKRLIKLSNQIEELKYKHRLLGEDIDEMIDQPLMYYQKTMYRRINSVRIECF